ncbi:MAG: alpha/beta hydrolase [Thermoanaerobaculia bacterium]|nr:alpha/beta hydrolase [Thermoanaerobaculia bacterium]
MADLTPDRAGIVERDGHDIYWERFGKGDRPTVCLLNGLAMHTSAWYGFLDRLIPEYDVLLWDYPGQGRSSSPDEPYFIDRIASYLDGILDESGIEKIHVMGVSWGGFVALEFARQFQERIDTLTVSGIVLSHEPLFQMYQDLSLRFYRGGPAMFELYTRYMYEKIFGEAFVRSAWNKLETMRQKFHERYKDRIHALIRLTEAQDPFFESLDERMPEYRAIRVPTLVIAGEEDRCISLRAQRKIVDVIPGARWEMIEGSGHVVYLEKPDEFWGMLKEHMRGEGSCRS